MSALPPVAGVMSDEAEVGTVVATRSEPTAAVEQEGDDLVALAIREKVPVEVLERLVALRERIAEKNARAAYFAALAGFQAECPEIPRTKTANIATNTGSDFSYKYAPLEAITRTIRPILQKYGLSYSWTVEESAKAGTLDVVTTLRHIDGHSETSRFPVPTENRAKMSEAQKNGSAFTFGRRQTLAGVLGITTADDIDGKAAAEADDDGELITEDQLATLTDRINEVGADFARFCAFMKVEALKDIRKADFDKAIRALAQRKTSKARAKK